MKRYLFTVMLIGTGRDQDAAYRDALESAATDPGDPFEVRELEDEEDD